MNEKLFSVALEVRDYECDYQGIVNNAVYMNYFEHARSLYAKSAGFTLTGLAQQGFIWVVSEACLKFKSPLRAGDRFTITLKAYRKGLMRIVFHQQALRESDGALMCEAETISACIVNGRPSPFPKDIIDRFKD